MRRLLATAAACIVLSATLAAADELKIPRPTDKLAPPPAGFPSLPEWGRNYLVTKEAAVEYKEVGSGEAVPMGGQERLLGRVHAALRRGPDIVVCEDRFDRVAGEIVS